MTVPGFKIDQNGFAPTYPISDRIEFGKPSGIWKAAQTSSTEQTVSLQEFTGNPSKVRASLLAPGFSLYFASGITFKLSATSAPYLTWTEGSASSGVPTPDVSWVVLSFRDAQPPLILGFPGGAASLQVTGKPGAWVVKSPATFRGWVRVGLPIGMQPDAANSAASLGKLAKAAKLEESSWTTMPPVVQATNIEPDEDGVVATWTFDHEGALIPRAATLAPLGNYPLKVLSPTRKYSYTVDKGPLEACSGNELKIRFPVRRMPYGRGLAIGKIADNPIGTVSALDAPSVVELALETLSSGRDTETRKAAEQAVTEYLSQAAYAKEPWTDQQLPYAPDGAGIDLASAHALLMQAISSASKPSSEANSLLTSVAWRCDWNSWLPWVEDPALRRRSASLAALAGAMCPEPERRLTAGMFQAGLSAEQGMRVWMARRGDSKASSGLIEPMLGVRQALFRLKTTNPEPETAFVEALLSPIRVYGDSPVRLYREDKNLIMEWPVLEAKPGIIHITAGYELGFEALSNLPRFQPDQTLGSTDLLYTAETAGVCRVKVTLPPWAKALPLMAPPPSYSEPLR